jgi:hypothetical protein
VGKIQSFTYKLTCAPLWNGQKVEAALGVFVEQRGIIHRDVTQLFADKRLPVEVKKEWYYS